MKRKNKGKMKFMAACLLLMAAGQLNAQGVNGDELRVFNYDADGNRIERRKEFINSTLFQYEIMVGDETVTMRLDTEKKEIILKRNQTTNQNGKVIFYKRGKIVKVLALAKEPVAFDLSPYKKDELQMEITIGKKTYTENLTW